MEKPITIYLQNNALNLVFQINLYYYDQLIDLQDADLGKPSYQHILSNGDSEPIGGFNIYEEKGCHSLFVQTRKHVFVIKFDHLKKSGVEMMIKSKHFGFII